MIAPTMRSDHVIENRDGRVVTLGHDFRMFADGSMVTLCADAIDPWRIHDREVRPNNGRTLRCLICLTISQKDSNVSGS